MFYIDPYYRTFIGRENQTATIKCDKNKGYAIFIIDAYYGPSDISKCPRIESRSATCKIGDRTSNIRGYCGNWVQSRCSFSINTSSLGDSCPGVEKKLRVSYYCSLPGVLAIRENSSVQKATLRSYPRCL